MRDTFNGIREIMYGLGFYRIRVCRRLSGIAEWDSEVIDTGFHDGTDWKGGLLKDFEHGFVVGDYICRKPFNPLLAGGADENFEQE